MSLTWTISCCIFEFCTCSSLWIGGLVTFLCMWVEALGLQLPLFHLQDQSCSQQSVTLISCSINISVWVQFSQTLCWFLSDGWYRYEDQLLLCGYTAICHTTLLLLADAVLKIYNICKIYNSIHEQEQMNIKHDVWRVFNTPNLSSCVKCI